MDRTMKDFVYKDFVYSEDKKYNLHADDCKWLSNTGLKETRWFLDAQWFIIFYKNRITYYKWINEMDR